MVCPSPQKGQGKGPKVSPPVTYTKVWLSPRWGAILFHDTNTIPCGNLHPRIKELMCLFLGIFLSLRKTMLSSPQVWVSMAYYSFLVFLETLWHVIMLMKLIMTVQDVWGLQVVHLLANIVRGWICPQREGKPVTLFFPPSKLNSLISYPSFRK